jgi:hypothetical protein
MENKIVHVSNKKTIREFLITEKSGVEVYEKIDYKEKVLDFNILNPESKKF